MKRQNLNCYFNPSPNRNPTVRKGTDNSNPNPTVQHGVSLDLFEVPLISVSNDTIDEN